MIRHAAALFAALSLVAGIARAANPAPAARSAPPKAPKPAASQSAGASASAPASFDLGVWTVHASSLDANFKTGDFSTPNKIVMTRSGGDVSADRANGNTRSKRCT